ncbi:MAG: ATP-binding protein [Deltaproteobacteria bacterium]|nr:ATP-binding protein [Deltaproteobacteria bacterium]
MLLALAVELRPEMFDSFILNNSQGKIYSEFGGVGSSSYGGFLPTVKTAMFTIAGRSSADTILLVDILGEHGKLYTKGILERGKTDEDEPSVNIRLFLNSGMFKKILNGENVEYEYSSDFPASRVTTEMEWNDLVLSETTETGLKELLAWQEHGHKLIDDLNMKRTVQPGYRALFYGPSGTGKTITASLIGKKTGIPVYRVDISQMVSKYIGETEKNLEKIFNTAEEHNWILFFDEADALFGKRTSIGTSNDKHANQETAYLLQRIESSTNIVILATNLKKNLDDAFTRRFQSIIHFPVPDKKERKRLWEGVFTEDVVLDDDIDLEEVAQKYDIAGGSIVNVARFSTLMALSRNTAFISKDSLMEGIKREHAKLGRTI